MKITILSLISIFAFSLPSNFTLENDRSKIVKTEEGVLIIPTDAGVTNEDAGKIHSILNRYDSNLGYLEYSKNGRKVFYGKTNLESLEAIETMFDVDMHGESSELVRGKLIVEKKLIAHDKNWILDERAIKNAISAADYEEVLAVLEKYN